MLESLVANQAFYDPQYAQWFPKNHENKTYRFFKESSNIWIFSNQNLILKDSLGYFFNVALQLDGDIKMLNADKDYLYIWTEKGFSIQNKNYLRSVGERFDFTKHVMTIKQLRQILNKMEKSSMEEYIEDFNRVSQDSNIYYTEEFRSEFEKSVAHDMNYRAFTKPIELEFFSK